MGVLAFPFRGLIIKVLLVGGAVVGAIFVAKRFELGTQFAEGANALGQAAGGAITQPIAGLTDALTKGINDIRLNAQELFGGLATAGADFQEAFTGNRDAIGDFFAGDDTQNERTDTRETSSTSQDETETSIPSRTDERQDEIDSINKTLNPDLQVTGVFDPLGDLKDLLSIRGTPLAEDAISRDEATLSGTITTEAGGTRDIRGSAELFERLNQNLSS